jgi:hypothetical protein
VAKARRVEDPERDERAPVFGRWSVWYAIVIVELVAVIVALYALTQRYR